MACVSNMDVLRVLVIYPGFWSCGLLTHWAWIPFCDDLGPIFPWNGVITMASLDLLGRSGDVLHRALGAESFRHQVRAQNLANIDTPAYKRQDVEFESYLAAELEKKGGSVGLKTTHARHIGDGKVGATPRIFTDDTSTMRYDGNNVDIDREMVALTETAIRYQTLAEQLTRQIRQLRTVISERVG